MYKEARGEGNTREIRSCTTAQKTFGIVENSRLILMCGKVDNPPPPKSPSRRFNAFRKNKIKSEGKVTQLQLVSSPNALCCECVHVFIYRIVRQQSQGSIQTHTGRGGKETCQRSGSRHHHKITKNKQKKQKTTSLLSFSSRCSA